MIFDKKCDLKIERWLKGHEHDHSVQIWYPIERQFNLIIIHVIIYNNWECNSICKCSHVCRKLTKPINQITKEILWEWMFMSFCFDRQQSNWSHACFSEPFLRNYYNIRQNTIQTMTRTSSVTVCHQDCFSSNDSIASCWISAPKIFPINMYERIIERVVFDWILWGIILLFVTHCVTEKSINFLFWDFSFTWARQILFSSSFEFKVMKHVIVWAMVRDHFPISILTKFQRDN